MLSMGVKNPFEEDQSPMYPRFVIPLFVSLTLADVAAERKSFNV